MTRRKGPTLLVDSARQKKSRALGLARSMSSGRRHIQFQRSLLSLGCEIWKPCYSFETEAISEWPLISVPKRATGKEWKSLPIGRVVIIACIGCLIQACAHPDMVWYKQTGTPQEFATTQYDCNREAFALVPTQNMPTGAIANSYAGVSTVNVVSSDANAAQRNALAAQCMQAHGWSLRPRQTAVHNSAAPVFTQELPPSNRVKCALPNGGTVTTEPETCKTTFKGSY